MDKIKKNADVGELQRIVLCVEYDGIKFHGWQRQQNAYSVQEAVESALAKIEGRDVATVSAGRTDSGVHAEAMVAHVDVQAARYMHSPRAYTHGVNAHLTEGVKVTAARAVAENFHARFDCIGREYRYQIWNRTTASALHPWRHWWMPRVLDVDAMERACACFIGKHDFRSLQASGCQANSTVRTIHQLSIVQTKCEIHVHVFADGFLYHMVRNIIGCLIEVGLGRWSLEELNAVIDAKSRMHAGVTAPAHGLYFTNANYPDFNAREM